MTPRERAQDIAHQYCEYHNHDIDRSCGLVDLIELAITKAVEEAVRQTDDKWRAKENSCIDNLRKGIKVGEERYDEAIAAERERAAKIIQMNNRP